MNRKLFCLLLVAAFILPSAAGAVTKEDFEVKTTQNLINLCTANPTDPYYAAAVHFCQGYLVGAYAYYGATNAGPEGERLVCFPDPAPSRNEAIDMFINWAKAHPEFMNEKPVETEFRFLMEQWPCKE